MAGDEYASVGGGSLKLKGVKGSKISKRKKKKHRQPAANNDAAGEARLSVAEGGESAGDGQEGSPGSSRDVAVSGRRDDGREPSEAKDVDVDEGAGQATSKTAAEIRHEERRRKILHDRLKREGTKSHKERVEELNKYLSGLSEHHDMPRIRPG